MGIKNDQYQQQFFIQLQPVLINTHAITNQENHMTVGRRRKEKYNTTTSYTYTLYKPG